MPAWLLTSELLVAVGAPAAASEVKFTALDAYEVTLSAEELRSGAVLLVTWADGQLLPVKEGGPTKIAFLLSSKVGKNKDLWIWSIKEMVVQWPDSWRGAGCGRRSSACRPGSFCCSSG